jgi:hypothetical protein
MRFTVVPMRRQGRRLDRHELANQEPVVGDLRVEEVRDESLGRYVRMARWSTCDGLVIRTCYLCCLIRRW